MTFFNKKEEVLKIELTPYGRKLLSQGKLKPAYYSFLDDDVLYNAEKGGFSETNSDTKSRILDETPYMKPQTNFKGIDTSVNNMEDIRENTQFSQETIGSNLLTEDATATWNISFLHGELSSSVNYLSSSTEAIKQIPQIESTIEFTLSVDNVDNVRGGSDGLLFTRDIPTVVKNDGTFVGIDEEQILLSVLETNGFSHKDSYEIEVYLYEQDETKLEKQLKFFVQDKQLKNGMLQEDTEIQDADTDVEITSDFVEYYLNIQTDYEIPNEDICSGIKRLEANDIFLDLEVDCPDREDLDVNFYGSRVTEQDLEDC